MKQLVLVRHGKSSWKLPVEDIARPLKKRAYTDAYLVARAFQKSEKELMIFTSPARRARTTAEIFKTQLDISDPHFKVASFLYTFDMPTLLGFIHEQDNSQSQLMLFGHNPAFTQIVNRFTTANLAHLPTTGLVHIVFEQNDWKKVQNGKIVQKIFPKQLREKKG